MVEDHVALEGNLSDFSLTDMFVLLQSGAKSGVLHVQGTRGQGVICFVDGRIYHASAHPSEVPVARRLVSNGIATEKQLRQAYGLMKIQKREVEVRKIGQILVDEGYIQRATLDGFLRAAVSDALFDLLRWDEGSMRFESEETCEEQSLGTSISVDDALADVAKKLETWERISAEIPTDDTRFLIAKSPGGATGEIHIQPREWMLLCHLHGGRSVRELVDSTGYGDFDTAVTLFSMFEAGLVEKVGPAGERIAR
jgi:hypothetical protein